MSNLQSQMSPRVPTYLPLSDAAKKYGLSEKVLTQMVQAGKIEAVQLPTGDLLVAAENNGHSEPKTKEQIITQEFTHLRGSEITIAEAIKNYLIPRVTLLGWIKLQYVRVVDTGHPMKVDEADVAYCAKVYHERGGKRGMRLFDEAGNPYKLKRPQLAEYRRRQKAKVVV